MAMSGILGPCLARIPGSRYNYDAPIRAEHAGSEGKQKSLTQVPIIPNGSGAQDELIMESTQFARERFDQFLQKCESLGIGRFTNAWRGV